MANVILKKGQGREFKSGGLWIYDNEIDRVEGSFENGDIIELHDFDDYFLGYGFINENSKWGVLSAVCEGLSCVRIGQVRIIGFHSIELNRLSLL